MTERSNNKAVTMFHYWHDPQISYIVVSFDSNPLRTFFIGISNFLNQYLAEGKKESQLENRDFGTLGGSPVRRIGLKLENCSADVRMRV